MLGLGLSLQKGVSAFNAGRALVSSYIRRVTDAGGVLQNTACDVAAINELNQDRLLEPASWVLVPDGIKEDVVYAQKPSSGLGDLTFTRASDATYTDSTGVVRRSPYNLAQMSEMFADAYWGKTAGTTITANTTVAPNGTLTADTVAFAASGDSINKIVVIGASIFVGTSWTASIYTKTQTQIISFGGATSGAGTNVYNGAEDVGNGWYRQSITRTWSASGSFNIQIVIATGAASTIQIWGAQLVEGTSALDYFPTTNRQDVPRIDFRNADGTLSSCGRLLLEPQRTNSIRNSSMVGAVAGSPGTAPTNWITATGGLSQTVIGIGTENGLPYIDYKLAGTATSTEALIRLEGASQISASASQSWTSSIYSRLISATAAPNSYNLVTVERNSGGTAVSFPILAYIPTSTLRRFSQTFTTSATTAFVQPGVVFVLTNGATYDFTIRIAAPQMELGAYATTWVPTTTAAVTRLADAASKTGVSSLIGQTEGTLFAEFDNTTTAQGTTRRVFVLSDGSSNNRIGVSINTVNSMDCFVTLGGVPQASIIFGTTLIQRYKVALAYAQNDIVFYVNGVQIGIDTSATIPSLSGIYLGRENGVNDLPLGSGYAQAALLPTRLTNDQLEVLTSEGYGNYALLAQSLNCVLQ